MVVLEPGEPTVIFYMDESGPPNPHPRPDRQWTDVRGKGKGPDHEPRPGIRAACTRT
ncbi:hypothetical protein [Streptosporangium fragile]|uniref:hypothetical protein n=1 Tax=Streptosporangium fragile TaxID=46186 RepID=UPI0031F0907D